MVVPYESVPLGFVARELDDTQPTFLDLETDSLYTNVVLAQFLQPTWKEALIVEYPNYEALQKTSQKNIIS